MYNSVNKVKNFRQIIIENNTKYFLFILACAFLIFSGYSIKAQQPAQTPAPVKTPIPARIPTPQETNRQLEIEQQRRQEGFYQMNQLKVNRNIARSVSGNLRRDIETLYRKTNKKELKTLAVDQNDLKTFDSFLKQNKAGLIKLIADLRCSKNQNIIVATEDCLKYSMPGGGSSYSFRMKDYRIPRLADLTFTDNSFQVTGKLIHGILVGIGDVPLEKVNLQSAGIKYLVDFQPVTKFEEALSLDKQLSAGITKDGFIYRRALNAVDNMTYVLRSIAYDGELYRAVNGITYNELDFDKRKDVIVAFRVVRREPDKSITILWKELESKDSLKIKRNSEEKKKVKENNFVAREGRTQ